MISQGHVEGYMKYFVVKGYMNKHKDRDSALLDLLKLQVTCLCGLSH